MKQALRSASKMRITPQRLRYGEMTGERLSCRDSVDIDAQKSRTGSSDRAETLEQ